MMVFVGLLLALWVATVIILLAAWALTCECVPFRDEPLP